MAKIAPIITLLASVCSAASIPVSKNNNNEVESEFQKTGVMRFPLFRDSSHPGATLVKRDDGSFSISLNNTVSYFSTVLSIGSDNQNIVVQVDTGSSDLWVMDSSNPYCSSIDGKSTSYDVEQDLQIQCSSDTMFDHSKSTSFNFNSSSPFNISYGDGSFANGSYCYDTIKLGGNTVENANFAIAEVADSSQDVWGIGLAGSEATVTTIELDGSYSKVYDNIPIQMKQQGLIKANAYSLFLNDMDATEGSLLFGGVDHSKYNGTLQTLPVISQYRKAKPNSFYVTFSGMSAYNSKNEYAQIADSYFPVLLDSGSSLSYLPTQLVSAIVKSVGAEYTGEYIVMNCNPTGGLRFDLGGINIDVDFTQMLYPTNQKGYCILGIMPSTSAPYILGDSFLRAAYVVYDLDNYEVGIAQASYDNNDEQVDVISDSIPSASQAPGYSSTTGSVYLSTTVNTVFTEAATISSGASIVDSISGNSGPTHSAVVVSDSSSASASTSTSSSARSSSSSRSKNGAALTSQPDSMLLSAFISVAGFFMLF